MNLITNYLLPTVYAQVDGVQGTTPRSGLGLGDFDFLKLLVPNRNQTDTAFNSLLSVIIGWILVIVAIIAFIYLIISGIKYITAGGDAAKATEARNGIVNALIGIIIVVISYLLLRYVGTLLT